MKRRWGYLVTVTIVVAVGFALVVRAPSSHAAEGGAPQGEDPFAPVRFLVGAWEGAGRGPSGTSAIDRTYRFVLQDKFLYGSNKSMFAPQADGSQGEIHEDWSIFSYDRTREKVILRQFHVEGFVNRYVLDEVAPDGDSLTFVTEAVENGPPRLRARLTVTRVNDDELKEKFELAPNGKAFSICVNTHLRRRSDGA